VSAPGAIPDQIALLHDVSWETYECLLADHVNGAVPRFTFDRGTLEIMSPFTDHEEYKQFLTQIVECVARGLRLSIRSLGSSTFKRSRLQRGFEADACFYVQTAKRMAGKFPIDPESDPGPDLVIEIETTSSALDKLPLFADFAVAEVWRYDGERLTILQLRGHEYADSPVSGIFPNVSAIDLTRLAARGLQLERIEWLDEVEHWVSKLR
jgi:Uma2 family endonuclease